jgi:hypothetical protein
MNCENWIQRPARVVASLLVLALTTAHTSANDKTFVYKYREVMSSSSARAKLGEVCFLLFSSMNAGDFFKGLHYTMKQGSRSADEFYKNGRIVSVFPEELEIRVGFETVPCVGNKVPDLSTDRVEDLLRSLQLEASWKRGVEYRPAELTGLPTLVAKPATIHTVVADTYSFRVLARAVPITDHLVVSVLGTNKKFLARVTFDLAHDLLPPILPVK